MTQITSITPPAQSTNHSAWGKPVVNQKAGMREPANGGGDAHGRGPFMRTVFPPQAVQQQKHQAKLHPEVRPKFGILRQTNGRHERSQRSQDAGLGIARANQPVDRIHPGRAAGIGSGSKSPAGAFQTLWPDPPPDRPAKRTSNVGRCGCLGRPARRNRPDSPTVSARNTPLSGVRQRQKGRQRRQRQQYS